MSVGSRSRRPSTAPLERGPNSPSAAGFIHRDIFAPSIPGGSYHHDEPVEGAFTTPKKHRKSLPSESFIPSAQRLERWNNKLGKYRQRTHRGTTRASEEHVEGSSTRVCC